MVVIILQWREGKAPGSRDGGSCNLCVPSAYQEGSWCAKKCLLNNEHNISLILENSLRGDVCSSHLTAIDIEA